MLTLLIPVANLLLGPALAVGGTLLVLSLEELGAADPARPSSSPAKRSD
jgi:hypothetical protein